MESKVPINLNSGFATKSNNAIKSAFYTIKDPTVIQQSHKSSNKSPINYQKSPWNKSLKSQWKQTHPYNKSRADKTKSWIRAKPTTTRGSTRRKSDYHSYYGIYQTYKKYSMQ
jgi:hypothetical protein